MAMRTPNPGSSSLRIDKKFRIANGIKVVLFPLTPHALSINRHVNPLSVSSDSMVINSGGLINYSIDPDLTLKHLDTTK